MAKKKAATKKTTEEKVEEVTIPTIVDPEWNDYVMTQFAPEELVEDKPNVAGLRRVVEKLIGPIIESRIVNQQWFPSERDPIGKTIVHYRVTIKGEDGVDRVFDEIGDVWSGNIDDGFAIYGTAVAATRGESRALRKALKLRTCSIEEITRKSGKDVLRETSGGSTAASDKESMASANQIAMLETKCSKLNINLDAAARTINSRVQSIRGLTQKEASTLIKTVVEWNNSRGDIPDEVKIT